MSANPRRANQQLTLFPKDTPALYEVPFPSTRFQGSKRKLVDWIGSQVSGLSYDTVLDVFGGTGAVSHWFKRAGKQVTYNDQLAFNWTIGLALVENARIRLSEYDIQAVTAQHADSCYPDFIARTFEGIYFTDDENAWLDRVVHNIDHGLDSPYKRALARCALFQACIIKRPYNLFHRANLYLREAHVERTFGNKTTWDTPFEVHFHAFAAQANAAVFDNGRLNRAVNCDAFETPVGFDLVYLDPPYLNAQGVGVDYRDFYHFLEGLTDYDRWAEKIDYASKHRRLLPVPSPWTKAESILTAFERVIARHRDSVIVISYRDDGIPSRSQLIDLLSGYKRTVCEAQRPQQYVLSKRASHEILLIGNGCIGRSIPRRPVTLLRRFAGACDNRHR